MSLDPGSGPSLNTTTWRDVDSASTIASSASSSGAFLPNSLAAEDRFQRLREGQPREAKRHRANPRSSHES
ncbi:hypothetical protein V8E54_005440 [Elaphomyces granulatus]